jgi:single-strand selective monofunctional uracil DNA glycosylase
MMRSRLYRNAAPVATEANCGYGGTRPVTLARISRRLSEKVDAIDARSAAAYVYNPLDYARVPHEKYLKLYGQGRREIVLLGMNPGPFGMTQTGVPFGDVAMVRDFLKVEGRVGRPPREHPKRPVTGFHCPKSEVSGTRLWGWVRDRFQTPEHFFARFFVVNYCPLVFMSETGANLTPDKLPKDLQSQLQSVCDEALTEICRVMQPEWVIGVGAFAMKQAERALEGTGIRVGTILHPSPASPLANRGWAAEAEKGFSRLGIKLA